MIFDCFPYFNEKELLELRVNTLKDHVDGFIIAEADRTHKGIPKPFTVIETIKELGLPEDIIQVLHVGLPGPEEIIDPWVRERAQRDALGVILNALPDDVLFIVSDCDEIVKPESLCIAKEKLAENLDKLYRMSLTFHVCRADLQLSGTDGTIFHWNSPCVTSVKYFKSFGTLSSLRASDCHEVIGDRDAGWHFTYMGSPDNLKEKLHATAHWADFIPNAREGAGALVSGSDLEEYIDNYTPKIGGTDPLGRTDHIITSYPVENLPRALFESERIRDYMLPPES